MTKHIVVKGITQGVGFRPFVYGLATRFNLHGWVCNTSNGVEISVQGKASNIESFIYSLTAEAPSASRIDRVHAVEAACDTVYDTFEIRPSINNEEICQPISADIAICTDCERELFDPKNRRYLYPFIHCAHCGPRFTISKDIPYDRHNTTMAEFEICERCSAEYNDPTDRRFYSQPIACPNCGPFVALREVHSPFINIASMISSIEFRDSAILKARRLLNEGYILAVKGLGGFHLVCDASNSFTVEELRDRKGRVNKPFAVMAANVATVRSVCELSPDEHAVLAGREKPITILRKKNGIDQPGLLSKWVAPNLDTLGVMLPYTALHHLLLNQTDPVLRNVPVPPLLVMTSGNYREEPIANTDEDALQKLSTLADAFLLHNREIYVRCDDSVVRVDSELRSHEDGGRTGSAPTVYLRRSRGYVPQPVKLPFEIKPTLALGGEKKNTFCLTRGRDAFLSHHIGDLTNAETCRSLADGVEHLSRILHIEPELISHDLNPDYFSTQYAKRSDVQQVAVQHHHAHIVSCMIDNGLDERQLIGLSFDGAGLGTDGAIWGGDALLASFANFTRLAHLEYLPLPKNDSAIRSPWRIAVAYAHALGIEIGDLPFLSKMNPEPLRIVRKQVDTGSNTQLTSSVGCLFGAVAGLSSVCHEATYDAQAGMELEAISKPYMLSANAYPYTLKGTGHPENNVPSVIRVRALLSSVVQDVRAHETTGMIGARFHRTIADIGIEICKQARSQTKRNEVVLSGGVWQNQILLNLVRSGLKENGFTVYSHHQVPTNDGGLALGQAVIANYTQVSQGLTHIVTDHRVPGNTL